jgi:hypothetical protein
MKFYQAFIFLFAAPFLFGQSQPTDARLQALGGVGVALEDVHSLQSNQAGLAQLENWSVLANAERRFGLAELSFYAFGAALPTRSGAFGVSFQQFGYRDFSQQKAGLAYARRLGENLFAGAQLDYFQTKISEYGSAGVVTFEAGIQGVISKNVILGAHVFNPAAVSWAAGERLPVVFALGASWAANEKATLYFDAEKDLDFPLNLKGGFEYRPATPIYLRLGFNSDPVSLHAGAGWVLPNGLSVNIGSSYHQQLGYSPVAGVVFSPKS